MPEVHAELAAPHADPLDVVGAEAGREAEHQVLPVSGGQARHSGVPVVVELTLEWMREHHTLPRPGGALRPHPEERVRPPPVVAEVLDENLVLLGREEHSAAHPVQRRLELPEQPLHPGEEGGG